MIISTITSGLGNQLFQYALARQLAILNKAALYFDTRFYHSAYSRETNRSFKLNKFNICYTELPKSGEYLLKAAHLFPGRSLPPVFTEVNEKYYHFDHSVLKTKAQFIILKGYWHSQKYFADSEEILRKELAFNNIPGQEFDNYKKDILGRENAVSVHIRRGDYVHHSEFSKTFGFLGKEYYENAFAMIVSILGECNFFIFTDDTDWAEINLKPPGKTVFVKNAGTDADLDDLHLMSLCRHHIIANSSYSWWGAWLGKHPGKLVIAPKKWFKNQPEWDTKDLLPESWIKI